MKINYSYNKSTEQQIKDHLWRMDSDFTPPLHTYVDINQYARKLATSAIRLENFMEENLTALIAFYYNSEKHFIFVSNLSIEKEYRGRGLMELFTGLIRFFANNKDPQAVSHEISRAGTELLDILAKYSKIENPKLNSIHAEVLNVNRQVILLYKRLGFMPIKIEKESTYLIKEL